MGPESVTPGREDVTGLQHRMKGTREKWRGRTYDSYLIAHEHLYVFRKPAEGDNVKDFRHSVKWWTWAEAPASRLQVRLDRKNVS